MLHSLSFLAAISCIKFLCPTQFYLKAVLKPNNPILLLKIHKKFQTIFGETEQDYAILN